MSSFALQASSFAVKAAAALRTGTLTSSIANLMKTIVGAGILGIPFAFGQTGLAFGMIMILSLAAIQGLALHFLALAVLEVSAKGHDVSFKSLAYHCCQDSKMATTAVTVCVILYTYGATVSYFIVIGDILPEVMEYFGYDEFPLNSRIFWMTAVGWLIEMPLSIPTNMSSLKFSSFLGMAGILYISVMTVWFACGGISLEQPAQEVSYWLPAKTKYTSLGGFAEAMSIFMYAFGSVTSLPTLVVELQDRTLKRIDAMIFISIALSSVFYVMMGVAGVIAFGASVEGNCLLSYPNTGSMGGHLTIFARVAIVVNVMGSTPLEMHPLRTSVSVLLFGKTPPLLSLQKRAGVTLGLFLASWSLACMVTSLDQVMAIVGSTANNLLGFFFPALFFVLGVKSQYDRRFSDPEESAEQGVVNRASFEESMRMRRSPIRKAAWTMAAISMLLMPVLTFGEVYKFIYEHH